MSVASVKLSDLLARTRELADMETASPGDAFVEDNPELYRAVNYALKRLRNKLIKARGDDYYAKSEAIGSQVSKAFYDLPIDFQALLKVIVNDGANNYFPVPRFNFADLGLLLTRQASGSSIFEYRQRLIGSQLEVRPAPATSTHIFTLHYIPVFQTLTDPEEIFDGIAGWEDWACHIAAAEKLRKEESFEQAAALEGTAIQLEADIMSLAGERDAGDPDEVQDVRRDRATTRYFRRTDWFD